MFKVVKMLVVILAILSLTFCSNGICLAQDDDGGGGGGGGDSGGGDYGGDFGGAGDVGDASDTAGDVSDAGDAGGAGDARGSDDRGNAVAAYQEEAIVETQYEEPVVPEPVVPVPVVTTSTTTNVTNVYTRGGYVYDRGRSAVVDAAVVGAVVGAVAVTTAANAGKSGVVAEKTTKRPVMIKKRLPVKTTAETAGVVPAVKVEQPVQAKNKDGKK